VQHRNNHQVACTKLSWFTGIVIFAILNQEASFFFWTNVSLNANSEGFPDSSNDTQGIIENTQHVVSQRCVTCAAPYTNVSAC